MSKTLPAFPLFELGRIVITPCALQDIPAPAIEEALFRHSRGDWGELCRRDSCENDLCLKRGGRLLSAYRTGGQTKFWIITEADRSATTVLLPSEY